MKNMDILQFFNLFVNFKVTSFQVPDDLLAYVVCFVCLIEVGTDSKSNTTSCWTTKPCQVSSQGCLVSAHAFVKNVVKVPQKPQSFMPGFPLSSDAFLKCWGFEVQKNNRSEVWCYCTIIKIHSLKLKYNSVFSTVAFKPCLSVDRLVWRSLLSLLQHLSGTENCRSCR